VPRYGAVKYGAIFYEPTHQESQKYYCLWEQEIPDFERLRISASRWLKFTINSENATDIQNMSQQFYSEFLPSCKYTLRELPELEYYHDGVTDFLVAIE
jgi:predicted transcriptional regulator YdeE